MHLHKTRHTVLMSPADSKHINKLKSFGVDIITTTANKNIRENEQYHADMQMLKINNVAFVTQSCLNLCDCIKNFFDEVFICEEGGYNYPDNVFLNAALMGNMLFCKVSALSSRVKEYCENNNIKLINVNQGYAKCSTLILNDQAIITADKTIHKAATENNIKSLLIRPGFISLKDADYGFIGGCSGVIGNTVFFFGDIHKHPDSRLILDFVASEGCQYCCTSEDSLCDLGGFVQIK